MIGKISGTYLLCMQSNLKTHTSNLYLIYWVNTHKTNPQKRHVRGVVYLLIFSLISCSKKIPQVRWNMARATNKHHDGKTYYSWLQCKWLASIFKHNKIIHVMLTSCVVIVFSTVSILLGYFKIPIVCMCVRAWSKKKPEECTASKRLWVNLTEVPSRTESSACTQLHVNCE